MYYVLLLLLSSMLGYWPSSFKYVNFFRTRDQDSHQSIHVAEIEDVLDQGTPQDMERNIQKMWCVSHILKHKVYQYQEGKKGAS